MNKQGNVIFGVKCQAEKCMYHTIGDGCSASQILVENKNACTSCETECKTFTPKQ
ncbi:MAG: DUF1540 domain-containing protein [Ruminococcaceae bacterium]|nr:DUF1540 domain-containing protein [Oscillospiraceae bacterium]